MTTTNMKHRSYTCAVLALLALGASNVMAQEAALGCGSLANNAFGPFDYNDPVNRKYVEQVEHYHFSPDQDSLKVGRSGDLALDIDYTLRAFPNHPRALWAMARYQLANRRPPDARYYTIECYFDRAVRWRPEDPTIYLVHGLYLNRIGNDKLALEKYQRALELDPKSTEAHYNIGLTYAKLERFEEAREHAQKAYSAGYPLPGLRNILQKKGEWRAPAAPAAAAAPAS